MKYAQEERFTLYHGDNREVLKELADNSIDSIVTDPPYELGFMGKSWDATGIAFNVEVWQECLRVLKPGGHLLAFSGSRTYHRMAVAIEDAGFEIRDQIMWIYGSGFPKSLEVSKAIDKVNGEPNRLHKFTAWMRTTGLKAKNIDAILRENNLISQTSNMAVHFFNDGQPQIATAAMWKVIRPLITEVPEWVDELVQRIEAEREVIGSKDGNLLAVAPGQENDRSATTLDITAPATDAAKQWQGWGTALKPAHEPIVVARKPLIGTVAANVLTYGTGGLNIDGGRVGSEIITQHLATVENGTSIGAKAVGVKQKLTGETTTTTGRWPANVIHDGSDEVVELFPTNAGGGHWTKTKTTGFGEFGGGSSEYFGPGEKDGKGSAARFFYCAKASKRDRNEGLDLELFPLKHYTTANKMGGEADTMLTGSGNPRDSRKQNHHPTVKPTDLMRYLCRLVTPKGGIVLDPFTGSGSTGKAAIYEGFNFIGIEMTEEYLPIAKTRIEFATNDREETLFDA